MDFKKKAGLALALAAIFTTGGANLALAETNVTSGQDLSALTGANAVDKDTTVSFQNENAANITLNGGGETIKNVEVHANTTKVTMTSNVTLAGDGGTLIAKTDGKVLETLEVANKTLTVGTEKAANSGGALDDITLTAGGAIEVIGGGLAADKVTFGGVGKITVGTADSAGYFVANNVTLAGSTIFADPTWSGDTPLLGSDVTMKSFGTTNIIDGWLIAGSNSRFSVNANSNQRLLDIVKTLGDRWNGNTATGINAAFGIFNPIKLDKTYGIYVDQTLVEGDTLPSTAATVSLANNSLLAVDMTNVGNTAATAALVNTEDLTTTTTGLALSLGGLYHSGSFDEVGGSADVTKGQATLYLTNAQTGTYALVGNLASLKVNGATITAATAGTPTNLTAANVGSYWTGDNAIVSSDLLDITGIQLVYNATTTKNDLMATIGRGKTAAEAYPMLSNGMASMVESLYGTDTEAGDNAVFFNSVDGSNTYAKSDVPGATGIAFVSRATDNRFMPNHEAAAAVIEGAAQIAVAAGVPAVTNNVITRISSLIVDHNNLLNETQPAYGNEPGKLGIWVNPFYATSDVDGMDAGRFESGYEMNYGGAAFGLDYNVNEAFRLGLAMNVGGGDTESNGDFNKTEADFDFFGVSLYGSYTNGAFGLTGDVGFTGVDSEIDQNVPGSMQMSNLESNVDSDAFTVGLTGQYRFAASDNFNITPHLGLRYTKISVDDANVDLVSGGRVFDVTTEDQNLFQIPVGVEFSSNIVTDGGWTVTPSADLGVLFTAGDTDVESRARIAGTSFTGRTSADVNDSAAFQGRLGVKAAADNGLSLGLDYGILAGANQTDHQFSGMLRFEF